MTAAVELPIVNGSPVNVQRVQTTFPQSDMQRSSSPRSALRVHVGTGTDQSGDRSGVVMGDGDGDVQGG